VVGDGNTRVDLAEFIGEAHDEADDDGSGLGIG
jgi:hypothetical protein